MPTPLTPNFFALLRQIEHANPGKPLLGKSLCLRDDPLRLGQRPYLDFATQDFKLEEIIETARLGIVRKLFVQNFGLLGPNGALPLHYTEHAYTRIHQWNDPTFTEFLDIFHHRAYLLFYRAWAESQPHIAYHRRNCNPFAQHLNALVGHGVSSCWGREALPSHYRAGLAGHLVADNAALATLPVTAILFSNALTTAPLSLFMGRYGRTAGFALGGVLGCLGGLLAACGVYHLNFVYLVLGMLLSGPFMASAQYYRFAATEIVPAAQAPRAISFVLVGGLLAALVVPTLAQLANDAMQPYTFVGVFLFIAGLAGGVVVPLAFLGPVFKRARAEAQASARTSLQNGASETKTEAEAEAYQSTGAAEHSGGAAVAPRSIFAFMKMISFWAAVSNAVLGYTMMSFVMTATPLAMVACGFSPLDGSHVVQGHVIAMYLPSLFTGFLIQRLGLVKVLLLGHLCFGGAFGAALLGLEIANFSFALIALGIGWNFCFIGGTTLLTRLYTTSERSRVQGLNETLVFIGSAGASFAAGVVLDAFGWQAMNMIAFAFLVVAVLTTGVYSARRLQRRPA